LFGILTKKLKVPSSLLGRCILDGDVRDVVPLLLAVLEHCLPGLRNLVVAVMAVEVPACRRPKDTALIPQEGMKVKGAVLMPLLGNSIVLDRSRVASTKGDQGGGRVDVAPGEREEEAACLLGELSLHVADVPLEWNEENGSI